MTESLHFPTCCDVELGRELAGVSRWDDPDGFSAGAERSSFRSPGVPFTSSWKLGLFLWRTAYWEAL